jgi:hypothetical protein
MSHADALARISRSEISDIGRQINGLAMAMQNRFQSALRTHFKQGKTGRVSIQDTPCAQK